MTIFFQYRSLIFLTVLFLGGCATTSATPDAVYYLVRHTEKTTEKPDPALTEAGQKRAQDLKARLQAVPLTAVYSSDYRRTRDTAAPVAKDKGLSVALYNPRELAEFAGQLSAQSGYILVVGHSNTTPGLAKLLGGQEGEEIVEATEYDRLYVIKRYDQRIESVIERYGDRTP